MSNGIVSFLYYYSYSLFRRIGSIPYLSRMQNKEKKKTCVQYSLIYYARTAVAQAVCICENRGSIYSFIILVDVALGYHQTDIVTSILLT